MHANGGSVPASQAERPDDRQGRRTIKSITISLICLFYAETLTVGITISICTICRIHGIICTEMIGVVHKNADIKLIPGA